MDRPFREILTIKVPAGSRTLYVDLAQREAGGRFLSISEVPHAGGGKRSRILLDEAYVGGLRCALAAVCEMLDDSSGREGAIQEQDEGSSRAYKLWTPQEEQQLARAYAAGKGVNQLAEMHRRAPTAILSRLYQVGTLKANERPRWD